MIELEFLRQQVMCHRLILPMFNYRIDAHGDKLQGYVRDGSGEQSNGYIMRRGWLA